MKSVNEAVTSKNVVKIVVDTKDRRKAAVLHKGKVIFTIKTDASGANPAIVVTAAETYLKSMEKGKTGILLWNGPPGLTTRNLKLN